MKLAMPIENGMLTGHFGHAPQFAFIEIDEASPSVPTDLKLKTPPPHEPGVLPRWLKEMEVTHVICGGIGARAVELLEAAGIKVLAGVKQRDPAKIVQEFVEGRISGVTGPTCDHGHHGHGGGCSK